MSDPAFAQNSVCCIRRAAKDQSATEFGVRAERIVHARVIHLKWSGCYRILFS
jgi:hypothetical protein